MKEIIHFIISIVLLILIIFNFFEEKREDKLHQEQIHEYQKTIYELTFSLYECKK